MSSSTAFCGVIGSRRVDLVSFDMDGLLSATQWFPVVSWAPRRDRRPHEPPVGGGLGSRERRGLANMTEMETGQLPLPVLVDKHQCRAQLRVDGVTPIGCFLGETANQDGCLIVHAHPGFIQGVNVVLQVAGLMPREPLLPGQQESERSDPDEVICQELLKESGITL